MDFIEKLLLSSSYNTILVIVDRLTKQSVFIPTLDTTTALILSKLFMLHVSSKHRVLSHVTLDWGTEFMSSFFWSLGKTLDIKLYFTSGYHPKGDGQTEHMNQTLKQYLWAYCGTTVQTYFWLPSLHTTMHQMPQLESHPSLPTKAITQTSPYTLNETLHLLKHETLLWT